MQMQLNAQTFSAKIVFLSDLPQILLENLIVSLPELLSAVLITTCASGENVVSDIFWYLWFITNIVMSSTI